MKLRYQLIALAVVSFAACGTDLPGEEELSTTEASLATGRRCKPRQCGPAPAMPNYVCSDGTVAGPTGQCVRNDQNVCVWEITSCPSTPTPLPPGGEQCGNVVCGQGQVCCNPSCGICTSPDGACLMMVCNPEM